MGRKLAGIDLIDVEFEYHDKKYSCAIIDHLTLNDMSVDEIKNHLDEIPARNAYWKALQVTVEREHDDLQEDYDFWFQQCYMDVDTANAKRTESWKKSQVMLENADEYRAWQRKLRDLKDVIKKINVLTGGYSNQIWTLREIARLTHAEISTLSASSLKGSGSLADI